MVQKSYRSRGLRSGGHKEAAGSYRSRSREEGPGRKRAAGGSRRKQEEDIKVEVVKQVLVESGLRGEQRGILRRWWGVGGGREWNFL